MKRLPSNAGFTLIELMIVVAIIGILASIAVPQFAKSLSKVRYARMMNDLDHLKNVAFGDYAVRGVWAADVLPDVLPVEWTPYLKSFPKPPCAAWVYDWEGWGTQFGFSVRRAIDNSVVFAYRIDNNGNNSSMGPDPTASSTTHLVTCLE